MNDLSQPPLSLPVAMEGAIRLNNAATTPPFASTLHAVNRLLTNYGALHRGSGPYATAMCQTVERAVSFLRQFFWLTDEHELLFTSNTSAAINLFARTLELTKDDMLLLSSVEHTSNHLPWRTHTKAEIVYISAFRDGSLDLDDFAAKLHRHRGRVKLVAVTGASNLSGYVPPIDEIASLAHAAGALFFVDAAQLAPHRAISMGDQGIDALACSAHKLFAPFNCGVLALPKRHLPEEPADPGGGSIDMLSESGVIWSASPARHQAGTWNVTGIVALAHSLTVLERCGWERIREHERNLIDYALKKLTALSDLTLYVAPDTYRNEDRIGTIPFNLKGYHHALLAAILEHEYSIETRAGTICNHRLVRGWLGISHGEQMRIEDEIRKGNKLASYGVVRASIGVHNTAKDIDALAAALSNITLHGPRLQYRAVPEEETYVPVVK